MDGGRGERGVIKVQNCVTSFLNEPYSKSKAYVISESPVSVKMRIRHYFSQLALHSTASYDLAPEVDPKCETNLDQIDSSSPVSCYCNYLLQSIIETWSQSYQTSVLLISRFSLLS